VPPHAEAQTTIDAVHVARRIGVRSIGGA
jgi:hypothetical protein